MIWSVALILALGIVLFIWAAWIEPRRIVIRHERFALPKLDAPLTLCLIGDVQPNVYHWNGARLAALFQRVKLEHDLQIVLWLGDYYNAPTDFLKDYVDKNQGVADWLNKRLTPMSQIAGAMGELKGTLGSYAILGNHDWAWSGDQTRAALEEVGISVLQDAVANVPVPGTTQMLQIVGYEDISSGIRVSEQEVHAKLDDSLPQICLSHSPDAFAELQSGPALMVSGHTHGGQVCLPFVGPIVLPVEHREYVRGWYERAGRFLFVTSGMGTSLPPFRFMVPPEIVILTLEPERQTKM
jgi:predicted MPP superfamily phosphohydrolase